MSKSKFNEQQLAFVLRQADEGTMMKEAFHEGGISVQTYCRWRAKYGGDAV